MAIAGGLARLLGGDDVASPVPLPEGVTLRSSRLIPAVGGRLSGMGRAAAAVTLGRTILVHPSIRVTERLVRHELVVRRVVEPAQAQRRGAIVRRAAIARVR